MSAHVPVLLNEMLDLMQVQPTGLYIDATFGRGGHSRALLARLDEHGRLLVIDRDPEAITAAHELAASDARVTVAYTPFSALAGCDAHPGTVDGILFDLGVSSPQVDSPTRGFSFRFDGPLDMRMDPRTPQSVAAWLQTASERDIADVLWRYGDERRSRQIAKKIVETRRRAPLNTTFELAELVGSCYPYRGGRIDPATRTFQALRIFINDELTELELGLEQALKLLGIGGRLLVIAFHSLEDRIVKRRFRDLDRATREADDSRDVPYFRLLARKAVQATSAETAQNPRARSARLRALERCA